MMNASDKVNFRGKYRQYDADGNRYLYKIGDVVELNNRKYVAIKPNIFSIPGTIEGNESWRSLGSDDAFYISELPPANAAKGDRWYVPSTGILYTYVKEESNQFWVEL
jgi:hypothetical protein